MSKSILLTGVTGFIGNALRSKLKEIYALTGLTRAAVPREAQADNLLYVDLADDQFVNRLPSNIDCVIHLAQSKEYRKFPDGAHDMRIINIDATCKLLEWARNNGVKQFIYSSTANVYGQSSEILTESHPVVPDTFYGASKLSAELLLSHYQQFFQVDILRLFTVYGPGQNGMLIPTIIERIKTSEPIKMAGGLGIYLSPIFVEDVVDIIIKLIDAPASQQSRLMNVCGNQITSLSEIVKILEAIIGKPAVLQMTDEPPACFLGSNERLKDYIGKHSFIDIQVGLERVVQFNNMMR